MIRAGWAGLVVILAASPALAQTGASAINPLSLIVQDESSGNATLTNPTSSASGLFQDVSATWAQALADCGCGTTAMYPTAASAPSSIQIAANAALINSQGLSAWLCPAAMRYSPPR